MARRLYTQALRRQEAARRNKKRTYRCLVSVNFLHDLLVEIDDYAKGNGIGRTKAINNLLRLALEFLSCDEQDGAKAFARKDEEARQERVGVWEDGSYVDPREVRATLAAVDAGLGAVEQEREQEREDKQV